MISSAKLHINIENLNKNGDLYDLNEYLAPFFLKSNILLTFAKIF